MRLGPHRRLVLRRHAPLKRDPLGRRHAGYGGRPALAPRPDPAVAGPNDPHQRRRQHAPCIRPEVSACPSRARGEAAAPLSSRTTKTLHSCALILRCSRCLSPGSSPSTLTASDSSPVVSSESRCSSPHRANRVHARRWYSSPTPGGNMRIRLSLWAVKASVKMDSSVGLSPTVARLTSSRCCCCSSGANAAVRVAACSCTMAIGAPFALLSCAYARI